MVDVEEHYLRNKIDNIGISLGSTVAGGNWARRALDPSDTLVDVQGMPDTTTDEIGIEKYQQTLMIRPPVAASATELYDYEIRQIGDPVCPFEVIITPQSNPTNTDASFTYVNSQISGGTTPNYFSGTFADRVTATTATVTARRATFKGMYQKARLLYQGVTIKQIASSLADQGSVIAVQQDTNPKIYQTYSAAPAAGHRSVENVHYFSDNDFPDIDNAANMPRFYQERSVQGCYQALHLSRDFDKWKNLEEEVSITSDPYRSEGVMPHMFCAVANGTVSWPLLNQNTGSIFLLGVPPGTTFMIKYIGAWEGLPYAGSSTTTHLQRSPVFDPVAMVAYSTLVAELMKDGYPASWNGLGVLGKWVSKAWEVIRDKVLPTALGAFQGYKMGGVPGAIGGGAMGLINTMQPGLQRVGGDSLSYTPQNLNMVHSINPDRQLLTGAKLEAPVVRSGGVQEVVFE